jgi:ribosomal RNA-processing protein 9
MELWWDGLCWHYVSIFNSLAWVSVLMNDISYQNWPRYGHQSYITGIDSLTRERCITSSDDKTIRVWKVIEETQLVFRYTNAQSHSLFHLINWSTRPIICKRNREFNILVIDWCYIDDVRGPMSSIECVSLLNEEFFVSGCQDGSLQLWSATRKKPFVSVPLAHGLSSSSSTPNWIASVAALKYRFISFFS